MNKLIAMSLVFAAIFAVNMKGANAIKCYQCSSLTNKNCDDPYSPVDDHLTECSSGLNACQKTKILGIPLIGETTMRSCFAAKTDGADQCESAEEKGGKGTSCLCTTDKCNHGIAVGGSILLSVASIFIASFFTR